MFGSNGPHSFPDSVSSESAIQHSVAMNLVVFLCFSEVPLLTWNPSTRSELTRTYTVTLGGSAALMRRQSVDGL